MSDERITDLILQRLENIERKIDGIQAHGCSKAEGHLRMQANEAETVQPHERAGERRRPKGGASSRWCWRSCRRLR